MPLGPINVWAIRILVIVTAVVLMILLTWWVRSSRVGKAVRAVSFDTEAAAMMGVDVDRVIVVTFLIGSALAGVGGVMVGLVFGRIFHLMGFIAGLKAFTAAVVGGIGSIPGAMLGGLLIGFAESYTTAYISSTFQNLIVFGLLIIFLLLRPSGILGRPELVKV
jgi:branched-chain amino acid transport system permease protein